MKYAQILNNKVHWIYEAEEQPQFAPNIVLVDITEKPEVREGWDYDAVTGTFSEPIIPEPLPQEPTEIELLQQENKMLKSQVDALSQQSEVLEGAIVELALRTLE